MTILLILVAISFVAFVSAIVLGTDMSSKEPLPKVIPPVFVPPNEPSVTIPPIEITTPAHDAVIPFEIPIPEMPPLPDFTFTPPTVPPPEINLPPLIIGPTINPDDFGEGVLNEH